MGFLNEYLVSQTAFNTLFNSNSWLVENSKCIAICEVFKNVEITLTYEALQKVTNCLIKSGQNVIELYDPSLNVASFFKHPLESFSLK